MTEAQSRPESAGSEPQRRESAVLVPVFRDRDAVLRVVLVRRAPGGLHGGQLAFPGGTRAPGDVDALDTALREAEEEIGLARANVEVIATLPPIATRTSGYRIEPFLARITRPSSWKPEPREVAEVLEIEIETLARPESRGAAIETFPTWPGPQRIEFLRVGAHRLWGASYRIFEPLVPRLLAGEWKF
ncbi:MAG TPA: CoA pyrophosphatase [Candidatus Sulfotelmatobacter sp.]|nr:CoA pyrophosphatase [Candidatus Sulfotelmatobacter sp.]